MDWAQSEPLFSEETCYSWLNKNKENEPQSCCLSPSIITILRQDRAIDEPPSLYAQCKNCGSCKRKKR